MVGIKNIFHKNNKNQCDLLQHMTNLSQKKNHTKTKNIQAPGEATNCHI